MEYWDEIRRVARVVEWRVERWVAETEDLAQMIYAILIIAFLLYMASMVQGFVSLDLGFRKSAMNWIRHST